MKITVVLNWLDSVNGSLVESVGGPAHATKLDVCDDPDDLRKTRRTLATDASTALLVATMGPRKTRDERMAAVDQVLQTYLDYSPGCTFANAWCQAPEAQYKDQKNFFGCSSIPAGEGSGVMAGWNSIALLAFFGRRRGRRRGLFGAGGVVITVLTMGAGNAFAGSDAGKEPPSTPEPTATSTTTITPAKAATGTSLAIPATVTVTTTTT